MSQPLTRPVKLIHLNPSQSQTGPLYGSWREETRVLFFEQGTSHVEGHLLANLNVEQSTTYIDYDGTPGHALLIAPRIGYSITPVSGEDCRVTILAFDAKVLFTADEFFLTAKFFSPFLGFKGLGSIELIQDDPETAPMYEAALEASRYVESREWGFELGVKGALYRFWYHLTQYATKYIQANPYSVSSGDSRANDARLYVNDHYVEQITLDDVAEHIHVSRNECCRCFKKTYRITLFEYINRYRIYQSLFLLTRKEMDHLSISDIALSVGFNSTSYYNKWFRKYCGCTPLEYAEGNFRPNATFLFADPVDTTLP